MALTRKFNSKIYHFHAQFMLRANADALQYKIRKAGGLARITYTYKRWIVWSRNK